MPNVFMVADSATTAIDTAIVGELVNLTKQVMGLFKEFPLNVLLIASIAVIGFTIFRAAKRATH